VDARGKAGGRGAWLVPTRAAFEHAESRPEKLRRALKTEGLVVEGLLAAAQEAILRHVLDLLSLAARAGALASGGDQVDEALGGENAGNVVGVVFPDDASPRSVEDVRRAAGEVPCFTVALTREALGHRIGKGPRAAVVLRRASVTMALVRELRKMEGLR
jgi:ribosomal protein L7Ae-like RNA K-turn-binding protein